MKLSNRLLLLLAAGVLFLAGSYGFYMGKNFELTDGKFKVADVSKELLELTDTIKNSKPFYFDFEHLVFEMGRIRAEVSITSDMPSSVVFHNSFKELETTDLFEFEIKGDTLYVKELLDIYRYKFSQAQAQTQEANTIIYRNSTNPTDIKLDIFTDDLKSITLKKISNVKVQSLPLKSGRSSLSELSVTQYPHTVFKIENLNLGTLNHHQIPAKKPRYKSASLYLDNGSANRLNFHNLNTELEAFDFPADSVYVKEASKNQYDVEIHANKYLNVDIADKQNLFVYKGHPSTIIKKERGLGRLINGNLPPRE
ncbi:MAG: hypothetical protein AAGG68_26215 [Bacteroidota bacterium]